MSFSYLFIYYFVVANIFFQIDRLEPSFTDCVLRFRFRDSVSVSGFRILCFSAAGFSNRTGTSVDDGARKLNNWLDKHRGKTSTHGQVEHFRSLFQSHFPVRS